MSSPTPLDQPPDERSRFRGTLLGLAVGDALGAPWEGRPACDRRVLETWKTGVPHPLLYTDDTHLSLATARSLSACQGFDGPHLAETLASHYEEQPWRGYGPGPPQVFARLRAGSSWLDAGRALYGGDGSFGNGAAMRMAPLGLFYARDADKAAHFSRLAARITHAHPIGQDGAVLQASAVAYLVAQGDRGQLDRAAFLAGLAARVRTDVLRDQLESVATLDPGAEPQRVVSILGHGIEAHRSVPTALYCFLRHPDSFADVVLFAVSLGGDADTIASMAGALAGAWNGVRSIPSKWRDEVENAEALLHAADELFDAGHSRS